MTARKLIMIIDDDRDIRETLGDLLEDEGFSTVRVADGAAALELLRNGVRPDLILLDLMMPGMNGWDFRSAQLADATIASIPVVVLTASRSADVPLDVDTVLFKPVKIDKLLDALDRLSA